MPGPTCEVNSDFLSLLESLRLEAPIICDVGSRDGAEGLFLLEALQGTELHIFEPNPVAADLCRQRLATLDSSLRKRTFFNQVAVGNRRDRVPFLAVDREKSENQDIGFSSFFPINPDYTRRRGGIVQSRILVDAVTLDSYFAGRPAPEILWVDVEGAELQVFEGAVSVLENVKVIHVEVAFRPMQLGRPLFWETDAFLRKQGLEFRQFIEIGPFQSFLCRHRLLPNPPWRLNAVYVKKGH